MEQSIERFSKIVKKPRNIYTITMILILLFLTWSPATGTVMDDPPYIVNTTSDENDGKCDDGDCSLRDAIILANNDLGGTIKFDIDPSDSGCIGRFCTIKPTSDLPSLTGGSITINGFTQPTASAGHPKIEIDGSKAGIASGLDISSSNNLVRGLVINRFYHYGIKIHSDANWNTISGNFIGTDLGGFDDLGNGLSGVLILGSNHNIIGGSSAFKRNVISGNYGGIMINNGRGNNVSGNYIGTDANGYAILGNKDCGVITTSSVDSIIGGKTENERNVISGNECGIRINNSNNNLISGNFIGTDVSGTAKLGNITNGIIIVNGSQNNTIGGKTESEKNVISGNQLAGVLISNANSDFNKVIGNNIGTDASGNSDLGNGTYGVIILKGKNSIVGPNNKIAYNGSIGVEVSGSDTYGNIITQNSIYSNGGKGIAIIAGANQGISAPEITSSSLGSVIIGGTACGKCTVELFQNSTNNGEGEHYLGADIADYRGEFSINIESLDDLYLTATATDSEMGTSEFSQVFTVKKINIHLPLVLK